MDWTLDLDQDSDQDLDLDTGLDLELDNSALKQQAEKLKSRSEEWLCGWWCVGLSLWCCDGV